MSCLLFVNVGFGYTCSKLLPVVVTSSKDKSFPPRGKVLVLTLLLDAAYPTQQSDPTSPNECLAEPVRPTVHSFCKVLTASDTLVNFLVLMFYNLYPFHYSLFHTPVHQKLIFSWPDKQLKLTAKNLHGTEWRVNIQGS